MYKDLQGEGAGVVVGGAGVVQKSEINKIPTCSEAKLNFADFKTTI